MSKSDTLKDKKSPSENELKIIAEEIYDLIRYIKDPEKPQTLEDLKVVAEENVTVVAINSDEYLVKIKFTPTVPHCSLATLIGLCLREKLERNLPHKFKLDIFVSDGSHTIEHEINKQINDKERIAAALENPNLKSMVDQCIKDDE